MFVILFPTDKTKNDHMFDVVEHMVTSQGNQSWYHQIK